jgi:glycosyltransferase involved in cell wall biosynthesis
MNAGVVPITFVSSHARNGGAERYLELLLEQLGPPWIRDVICLEEGPLAERLRGRGYPTDVIATSPRPAGLVASAWTLRRRLRRTRPAVVHANGIKAALVAVLGTVGTRTPVVWLKHDVSRDGWLARLVARGCRLVIGVSSAVTNVFGSTPPPKVHVIHNGIKSVSANRDAGRRLLLEALGERKADAVVALVGRLDPFKGHRELIAVLPTLLARRPGLRLAFLGADDPSHPGWGDILRREVNELGAADAVAFLGYREDTLELLAGCDVVVIASVPDATGMGKEGFSYVALESLAVGTPVVAYADGGVPEVLGDCGYLVSPGDRAALADAILTVLEDGDLRARLTRCGRARLAERFSLPQMVAALTDRYREVASNAV